MAQSDRGVLAAGFVLMDRGMDSAIDPRLLPPNQAALLVNATVRGGCPRNRPGWKKVPITYEIDEEDNATTGRFQGASVFQPRSGLPLLVASIGGRQYRYDVWAGNTCQDITIAGDPAPSNALQTWFTQAEDWLLMQDGSSRPFCYDGATSRRLTIGEVPGGTVMEYALGRLWIASPDGKEFVAGDLVGSSSGSPAYAYRDAVLKFTENTFLNEGGSFAVPYNSGGITAIRYAANLDSSLGQGPIEVFTTNGAFSINAPFDRTTWKNLTYPIQTVSLASPGAMSQNGTVRINNDIWYRSIDGIRSYIVGRRDQMQWGCLPVSEEMVKLLDYDTPSLLRYSSAVLFDNRLIATATPVWDQDQGVYHRALAVMDFDLISTIGARVGPEYQPAWDGMWTGRNIFQLVLSTYRGMERCFAFTWNSDDEVIELFELTTDGAYDYQEPGVPSRIKWGFETRLFDFGTPNSLKSLERADVAPGQIQGTVDFDFKYRSDEDPCWKDWNSFQLCATDSDCTPTGCWTPTTFQKSFRSRVTLPAPPDSCTSQTTRSRSGTRHQARVEITGACAIKQMVLYSRILQEAPFNGCQPSTATCTEDTCCPEDNYFESV